MQNRNLECRREPPYENTSHSWPTTSRVHERPNTRVHGWRLSKNHHSPPRQKVRTSGRSPPQLQIGDRIGWIELSMRRPLITLITVAGVRTFREKLLFSLDRSREKGGREGGEKKGRAKNLLERGSKRAADWLQTSDTTNTRVPHCVPHSRGWFRGGERGIPWRTPHFQKHARNNEPIITISLSFYFSSQFCQSFSLNTPRFEESLLTCRRSSLGLTLVNSFSTVLGVSI